MEKYVLDKKLDIEEGTHVHVHVYVQWNYLVYVCVYVHVCYLKTHRHVLYMYIHTLCGSQDAWLSVVMGSQFV